ncbi:MAG: GH3 auxin-responsive promoter family protein [Acidimicrobiales bacterium]
MTSLLSAALKLQEARHARRFERATRDPAAAQARVLDDLLARNANTAFGRDHRFSEIAGPADYARCVPVRDYEAHRPYVERAIAGERDVLTVDPLTMLTLTSGTTAAPKFIPVTAKWSEQMAGLTRLWMFHALAHHPTCFDGKVLMIASPAVEGHTPSGLPFGSMSGVAYRRIPRAVRQHYAVPYPVSLIKDHDLRYFMTMRLALAHDVTALATPNASSLLRLAAVASAHAEEMIRAIHDGTLGVTALDFAGDTDITRREAMDEMASAVQPDPARARALDAIWHEHGALNPRHCWPNLAFIGCWLGGSAGIHADHLDRMFAASTPKRDLGLIASEGRMTVPLADGSAAGPLAVHANYYEFIPEDRIDDVDPPVLLAHELEGAQRYYVVLSGGNGLYRYDINDIVEVRGFHNRTPKVAFVRKGRDMVSIVGEKLHLNQIQAAVRHAEIDSGFESWQFRLIPDVDQSRYDLLVESTGDAPSTVQAHRFINAFDRELARHNLEYASKRSSSRLGAPRLHVMTPGWSESLCRSEFANGKREAQHKWTSIVDQWDRVSREHILATAAIV